MKSFGQFHDGRFDGLWIDGKSAHLFLCTEDDKSFAAVLSGVAALSASDFKAGNIILSVEVCDGDEITSEHIVDVYDLRGASTEELRANEELQVRRRLAEAREKNLLMLAISASYGAICCVLAESVELLPRADWVRRYPAREIT